MDALTDQVQLRCMIRRDMDQVIEIDRQCFADPWGLVEFCERLRQRNVMGLVAESGERICGYFLYELRKNRFDIFRLAVDPELWREGVGSKFLQRLQNKLHPERRHTITALVAETNLFGQLFLRSQRFRAVHTFSGCFDGRDGYMFEYRLPGVEEDPFD